MKSSVCAYPDILSLSDVLVAFVLADPGEIYPAGSIPLLSIF